MQDFFFYPLGHNYKYDLIHKPNYTFLRRNVSRVLLNQSRSQPVQHDLQESQEASKYWGEPRKTN